VSSAKEPKMMTKTFKKAQNSMFVAGFYRLRRKTLPFRAGI
jgi:hypothetical protein